MSEELDEESVELVKRPRILPVRILFSVLSCLLALFFSYMVVMESPRDFLSESPHFWNNLVFSAFGAFSFWMITIGLPRHCTWQLWCGVSALIIGIATLAFAF